jgi:glucose-1-phosphate adenylyltransferase
VLPDVEVHRNVRLRNCVVDRYCALPAGLTIGFDPDADRKRFFVTDRGVTLVTPEMLGQDLHHLR